MCANISYNQWQQSTICDIKWDNVEDARERATGIQKCRRGSFSHLILDEYSNPNDNNASNYLFVSRSYSTEDSNVDISFSSSSLDSDDSSTSISFSFTPTVSVLTSAYSNTYTTAEQQRYFRRLRREQHMLQQQARLNEPIEETLLHIRNNSNNNNKWADADRPSSRTQINLYRIMNVALLLVQ